jgi:hypothetical protein
VELSTKITIDRLGFWESSPEGMFVDEVEVAVVSEKLVYVVIRITSIWCALRSEKM